MICWEYAIFVVADQMGTVAKAHWLTEQGKDGWELVAVTEEWVDKNAYFSGASEYIFKRPIRAGS